MRKVIFLSCIAITISLSSVAQSKTNTGSLSGSSKGTSPVPHMATIAYDSTTRFTQQFLRELNGVTYRIVLNECPYDGKRNDLLVYKMDREMPAISYMFNIAPSVKNFRVLISDDNKKLVVIYEYSGEQKIIEFN